MSETYNKHRNFKDVQTSIQCVRPYFAAKENDFCTDIKNLNTYSD